MTRSAADTAPPPSASSAAVEEELSPLPCAVPHCLPCAPSTPVSDVSAEEAVTGFSPPMTLSGVSAGPTVLGVTALSLDDFSAAVDDDSAKETFLTLKRLGVV